MLFLCFFVLIAEDEKCRRLRPVLVLLLNEREIDTPLSESNSSKRWSDSEREGKKEKTAAQDKEETIG